MLLNKKQVDIRAVFLDHLFKKLLGWENVDGSRK